MKTLNTLFIALVLLAASFVHPLNAQVQNVTFQAITGLAPVLISGIAGTPGTTPAYYVLMANYTGGSIPSNIITLNNVPGTLNSTNFVSFLWQPVAGVVSYDLLKLTSASLPSGSNSVALHSTLSATTTTSSDQGSGLSSYTIAAPPVNATAVLFLNSRDHIEPMLELDGNGGTTPGLSLNSHPLSSLSLNRIFTDATATGVTLTAAHMIGGYYFHAPTGAVNDTTDTAANIISILPFGCYFNSTSGAGSAFLFNLYNNSAGANTITVLPGTGVTLVSSVSPLTVAQNKIQPFVGIVTACGATPTLKLISLGNAVTY